MNRLNKTLLFSATAAALLAISPAAGATDALASPSPVGGSAMPVNVHVTVNNVDLRAGYVGQGCVAYPSVDKCKVITTRVVIGDYRALCQKQGQMVTANGYTSNWWTWIYANGKEGFIANIFLNGHDKQPGVLMCK